MDNANLLKAPGYELVNLNLHYTTDLQSDYLKSLFHLFFEVRNVFDKDIRGIRQQYREFGNRRGYSKPRERPGQHRRLHLCRIAAHVHRRNEACVFFFV